MRYLQFIGLVALATLVLLVIPHATTVAQEPTDVAQPADVPTDEPPPPPTEVPPTDIPPTEVPPTDIPPTEVPPTDIPPTEVPPGETPVRPSPQPEPTTPPNDTPVPTSPPDNGDGPRRADPRLTKTTNTETARVGDTVVYNLAVTVEGNAEAAGVIVEDTFPPYFEIVDATTTRGQIVINGQTVGAWIGTVDEDETVDVRIILRITSTPDATEFTNLAVLTTTSATDDPSNNTATAIIFFPEGGGAAEPTPTPTASASVPTETGLPLPVPATATPILAVATPISTPIPQTLPETGPGPEQRLLPLVLLGLLILGLGFQMHQQRQR